jgi:nuclear transport factor 2 (NTF2) superfamily protein
MTWGALPSSCAVETTAAVTLAYQLDSVYSNRAHIQIDYIIRFSPLRYFNLTVFGRYRVRARVWVMLRVRIRVMVEFGFRVIATAMVKI